MLKKIKNGIGWILLVIALFFLGRKKVKDEEKIVKWSDMYATLKKAFGDKVYYYLVDAKYRLPNLEEVKKFLAEDETNKYKYKSDFADCDNFSLLLAVMAFIKTKFHLGIANSKIHSYNVVLLSNMEVKLIEPQNDMVFSPEEIKKKTNAIIREKRRKGILKSSKLSHSETVYRVKKCVKKASEKFPKGQTLDVWVNLLDEELEKEGIGDKLNKLYDTVFIYYT